MTILAAAIVVCLAVAAELTLLQRAAARDHRDYAARARRAEERLDAIERYFGAYVLSRCETAVAQNGPVRTADGAIRRDELDELLQQLDPAERDAMPCHLVRRPGE